MRKPDNMSVETFAILSRLLEDILSHHLITLWYGGALEPIRNCTDGQQLIDAISACTSATIDISRSNGLGWWVSVYHDIAYTIFDWSPAKEVLELISGALEVQRLINAQA